MFAFGSVDEIALLATQVSHLTLVELHFLTQLFQVATLLRPFKKVRLFYAYSFKKVFIFPMEHFEHWPALYNLDILIKV